MDASRLALAASGCFSLLVAAYCPAVGASGDSSSLILHLKLDDGMGSLIASDSSSGAVDGDLINMDENADWVAGIDGLALDFDGVNDYVELPDVERLDLRSNISVSAWVFKRSPNVNFSDTSLVMKWASGAAPGTNEWLLGAAQGVNTENPTFAVEIGSTLHQVFSTVAAPLNQWHHIVGVRDGATLSIYLNGILTGRTNTLPATGLINNVGRKVRIAANEFGEFQLYSDLIVDDVQIYDIPVGDGGVAVGEQAQEGIRFLFENPGVNLIIFSDSFEIPKATSP